MLAEVLVYIGTVTSGGSEGIYLSRLNLETGQLSVPVLAAKADHPNFLTTDPQNRVLYSTGKPARRGEAFDSVVSFRIDRTTGELTRLNGQAVQDLTFCHINTACDGRVLLGADYGHAKAAAFPLGSDGQIAPPASLLTYDVAKSVVGDRQQSPHVHSINADKASRFVYVCDFSADRISICALDSDTAELRVIGEMATAPGSGPRHLVLHPNRKWGYVINELNGSITGFDVDPGTGRLTQKQTVATLPEDFRELNTTAEIALSPDRRFLYGSNRGHDSLACYRVDPMNGELTQLAIVSTEGQHPRNFTIDPSGNYLVVSNRDSDNVVVFRLDRETGIPTYTGNQISVSKPMCIRMVDPN